MKSRTKVSVVVAALAFIALAALGFYLYNFDYRKPLVPKRAEYIPLEAKIALRDASAGKVLVDFSLRNATGLRALLLDTEDVEPLLQFSLGIVSDLDQSPPPPVTPVPRISRDNPNYNLERAAIVELLPERTFTRSLNLARFFELKPKIGYRLIMSYRPSAFSTTSDANVNDATASFDFELP
jgi:hypothetical protein